MSKIKKMLLSLTIVLSFVFITIGFAVLTDNLMITGTIEVAAAPPKGVVITSVEPINPSNVSDVGSTYVSPTNLKSIVNVTKQGSITYRVTFENKSDATYWFRGMVTQPNPEGYQNDLIGSNPNISIVLKDKTADTTNTFNTDDWMPPNTTREVYVVYNFGANTVEKTISTLINFKFGERVESYADEILAILNNPEKYATLSEAFNETYAENGSTILGNMGADKALFDSLLGSDLTLDGKPVTIMIQRIDVDDGTNGDSYSPSGPTGCEYTIYVTTDDPTTGTPTVHAVSYTRESNGVWVQIGELYEGTTPIGTYVDSDGVHRTSLNIEEWKAVKKTYTVFTYKGRTVTYKVADPYGNSFQQQATIEQIMSLKDVELFNQLDKPQILVDIYKILFKDHVGSTDPEILLLREAYDNAMRFYTMRNNGQQFDLDNQAKRAEILSTIEALAAAMDYYTQVHDSNHA